LGEKSKKANRELQKKRAKYGRAMLDARSPSAVAELLVTVGFNCTVCQ